MDISGYDVLSDVNDVFFEILAFTENKLGDEEISERKQFKLYKKILKFINKSDRTKSFDSQFIKFLDSFSTEIRSFLFYRILVPVYEARNNDSYIEDSDGKFISFNKKLFEMITILSEKYKFQFNFEKLP